MTITLRPIRMEDLDAVRDLQIRAWSLLAKHAHSPDQINAHNALIRDPSYAQALLSNNLLLAVDDGDKIIGSAGWCTVPDTPGTARIRKVFIDPSIAGTGLGRRLVAAAEADARAKGYTRFTVRSNANAEGFYAALGYRPKARGTMDALGVDLPVVFMEKE